MSFRRWLPHEKVVAVRTTSEGNLVVRPRRLSPWTGASLATSVAAGVLASVALIQAQSTGYPAPGSFLLATLVSIGVAATLGKEYRNHPERWRFVGWWAALLFAKAVFAEGGFLMVMPIELLGLLPAFRGVKRASMLKKADFTGSDMSGADISFVHFTNVDFLRTNLAAAQFSEVVFEGCRFNGTEAEGCRFIRCKFFNCQFQDARLPMTKWQHSDIRANIFARAVLRGAEFDAVDLRGSDFENADFCGAKFQELEMVPTRLQGTRLAGVRYDVRTIWSPDATPVQSGAVREDE